MLWPSGNNKGRLGVDELPGSGSNYPFLLDCRARDIVEDLKISTDLDFDHELLLLSLAGIGQQAGEQVPASVHQVDLQIGDRDRQVLFDTRTWQFSSWTWLDPVSIYRWQHGGTVIEAAIRREPESKSSYLLDDGVLDDRTLFQYRQPVTGLELLLNASQEWWPTPADQSPRFLEGHNITFGTDRLTSDRGEIVQQFSIDVVPGSGQGRGPACSQQIGVTSLAGAEPNQTGNLTAAGSDCIGFRPVVEFGSGSATILPGMFQIYDICQAPCTCDDFSNVANYVIRSWNKFVVLAARVKELQASYREVRDLYIALRDCSKQQPMKVHTWRTGPNTIGIGVSLCNLNDSCLTQPVVRVQVVNQDNVPVFDQAPSSYTNQTVAGTQRLKRIPASWSGDSYRTAMEELPTGHKGFLFIRYRIGDQEADQSGQVIVNLFGVSGPLWDNRRTVTVPYS